MAFQFPDPNVTPEFTGANGITYSWDAADSKWRVKSFSSTGDIFYQDDAPKLVDNPGLAEGDLWVNSNNLLLYVWTGDDWVEVGSACGNGGSGGGGLVTTRDVKTVPRDDNYAALAEAAEMDPVDDLLQTQEDVNDFIAHVSERALRGLQRTTDSVDFLNNFISRGAFARKELSSQPGQIPPGSVYLLKSDGSEALTFEEVERVTMSKTGIGPYADFTDVKVGDNISVQNDKDINFGTYIVEEVNLLGTAWDFVVRLTRAVGTVADVDENLRVKTARPVFTVAQDNEPVFSKSGQLWYDTARDALFVWDDEDQQFYRVGGEESAPIDLDPVTDRIDNVEQLQRYFHNIVSEGTYEYPSFQLADPFPATGQYVLSDRAPGSNWRNATNFVDVQTIRISAVAGINSHLERAAVGMTITAQVVGTPARGVYTIDSIDSGGTGPDEYFEFGVTADPDNSDGNIEEPHFAQVQVFELKEYAEKEYVDDEIEKIREELGGLGGVDVGGRQYRTSSQDLQSGHFRNAVSSADPCPINVVTSLEISKFATNDPDGNYPELTAEMLAEDSVFVIERLGKTARMKIGSLTDRTDHFRVQSLQFLEGDLDELEKDVVYNLTFETPEKYLPLTGGTLQGTTDGTVFGINKLNGSPIVVVSTNGAVFKAEYTKNIADPTQIGAYELINGAILDNAMNNPTAGYLKDYLPLAGGNVTGHIVTNQTTFNNDNQLVSKKYVDDNAGGGGSYVSYVATASRVTSSLGASHGDIMFTGPNGNTSITAWSDVERIKIWRDDIDAYTVNRTDRSVIKISSTDGALRLYVQLSAVASTGTDYIEFKTLGENYVVNGTQISAFSSYVFEVFNVFQVN